MVYPGMFDLVLSRKIYYSGKNTLLEIVASRYGENSGRIMSLLSAGGTVLSMVAAMVLSKGLGMVRSMCMAAAYGTGYEANAFSAASRIPLSFFDLLFSAAILPETSRASRRFSTNLKTIISHSDWFDQNKDLPVWQVFA